MQPHKSLQTASRRDLHAQKRKLVPIQAPESPKLGHVQQMRRPQLQMSQSTPFFSPYQSLNAFNNQTIVKSRQISAQKGFVNLQEFKPPRRNVALRSLDVKFRTDGNVSPDEAKGQSPQFKMTNLRQSQPTVNFKQMQTTGQVRSRQNNFWTSSMKRDECHERYGLGDPQSGSPTLNPSNQVSEYSKDLTDLLVRSYWKKKKLDELESSMSKMQLTSSRFGERHSPQNQWLNNKPSSFSKTLSLPTFEKRTTIRNPSNVHLQSQSTQRDEGLSSQNFIKMNRQACDTHSILQKQKSTHKLVKSNHNLIQEGSLDFFPPQTIVEQTPEEMNDLKQRWKNRQKLRFKIDEINLHTQLSDKYIEKLKQLDREAQDFEHIKGRTSKWIKFNQEAVPTTFISMIMEENMLNKEQLLHMKNIYQTSNDKSKEEMKLKRQLSMSRRRRMSKAKTKKKTNAPKKKREYNLPDAEETLRLQEHQMYMKRHANFQQIKAKEKQDIDQHIKNEENKELYIFQPELCPNIPLLMDENSSLLVTSTEYYNQVRKLADEKRMMEEITQQAKEMTNNFRGHADKMREKQLIDLGRKTQLSSYMVAFSSNKTDYLVRKFVKILKQRVEDKRNQMLQKANEELIQQLLKQKKNEQLLSMKQVVEDDDDQKKVRQVSPPRIGRPDHHRKNAGINILTPTQKQEALSIPRQKQSGPIKLEFLSTHKQKEAQPSPGKLAKFGKELFASTFKTMGGDSSLESLQRGVQSSISGEQIEHHSSNSQSSEEVKSQKSGIEEEDSDSFSSFTESSDMASVSLLFDYHTKRRLTPDEILSRVIAEYTKVCSESSVNPLSIFNLMSNQGVLPLIFYKIVNTDCQPLQAIFSRIVPTPLQKIYFIQNDLHEKQMRQLLMGLFYRVGLKSLVIIKNSLGPSVIKLLYEKIEFSDSLEDIKRLVLKDPMPAKISTLATLKLTTILQKKASSLYYLKKLTLCRVGLTNSSVAHLAQAVTQIDMLEQLDISTNMINHVGFIRFFTIIHDQNQLRLLNLSYNQARQDTKSKKSIHEKLVQFLHHSMTLIHLDLSGMSMSPSQCKYILSRGVRKSRSLQALHMSGMGLQDHTIIELRRILKVKEILRQTNILDPNIIAYRAITKIHTLEISNVFGTTKVDAFKAMNQLIDKNQNKQVAYSHFVKESIRNPIFTNEEHEKLVFYRILGRMEMFGSHRWVENTESKCHICKKMTYCLVMWNKRAAEKKHHQYYFKRQSREPLIISHKQYKHPFLCTKDQVHRMLPVSEFLRLLRYQASSNSNIRSCSNENEAFRLDQVLKQVIEDFEKEQIEPTYFKLLHPGTIVNEDEDLNSIVEEVERLLPKQALVLLDLKKYAKLIDSIYTEDKQLILEDTYMCAVYAPDSHFDHSNLFGFAIKHPYIKGVDCMLHIEVPRLKHNSINKKKIPQKRIKKIVHKRYFVKAKSMFKNYIEDSPKTLLQCFDHDLHHSKLHRFVRDKNQYAKVFQMLKQKYEIIKNSFMYFASSPRTYPNIEALDFSDLCHNVWKIMGNISMKEYNLIFVATNYDEEENENNEENSLCRYEYFEIVARLAKCKFYDKGKASTVAEAVEMLLNDHILPSMPADLEFQQFRYNHLWNLEMDDLIRANASQIKALYQRYGTKGSRKQICKEDIFNMVRDLSRMYPYAYPQDQEEELKRQFMQLYGFSKMTIVYDMDEFDKYNLMTMSEFYEFIGRMAHWQFKREAIPFIEKYTRTLNILLPLADQKLSTRGAHEHLDSDSDCVDDIVDEIIQKEF